MYYVYVLRSATHPDQTYFGSTADLDKAPAEHNAGKLIHTNKFKPWAIAAYIELPNQAQHLERYLKTGSGRAFAKRHLKT